MRWIVSIITAFSLIVGGLLFSKPQADLSADFSDREMVAGIAFGVGPVANQLGEASAVYDDFTYGGEYEAEAWLASQQIVDESKKTMSTTLADIRSDNPHRVEIGLASLGHSVQASAKSQQAGSDVDPLAPTPDCGVAVVCVGYAAVAVHNAVVVTGLAAVVVGGALFCGVWKWCSNSAEPASVNTSAAAKERFVIEVMTTI